MQVSKMKDNTLFKQMMQLSQSELESMCFTRQGTVRVVVKDTCKLPDVEVKGADVKIGDGQVLVTKPYSPKPYAGNTSRLVHQSESSYGTTKVRVTKDGEVRISFKGTTKSVSDTHDAICALELATEMLAQEEREINTQELSDEIMIQYNRAKELYDKDEKKKVKSWEKRDRDDFMKIK